ncbi:NAD(P)-dependent oxidoreductase [Proteobacteria bacterium 005FR1]|nr:NAD(P)-dependent oxidoreductase [Proteobacteria bacterium 005FR1]
MADSPATTVAFIGLGVMGYPMAGHLQNSGWSVQVYNRTREKALAWQAQYGGTVADSPRKAADSAEVVFTCVGDDEDLRSVVLGENGALAGMKPGAVLVDHTTASAQLARELHSLAQQRNCGFLDAPVSGGQKGAELGALSIMAGGEADVYERAEPVFRCYAKAASLIGPPGAGQLCKMVNQICIAGLLEGLSEGLHFAQNAGLNIEKVIEVISKGAAQSWQMENRYATMMRGEYQHGFAVDWMRKDLRIALSEARANGSQLPVTALVDQFYADVQAMGGRRWDTSSLLARLQRKPSDNEQ